MAETMDTTQAQVVGADVFRVYRKYPNRGKKELLLETSDEVEAHNCARSHDWDDTYETFITKNGFAVERS